MVACFFFSRRRRHTRLQGDWSSDVCSSDLGWTRNASVPFAPFAPFRPNCCLRSEKRRVMRSEEHKSELQSPCISYAVFCLKKKNFSVLESLPKLRVPARLTGTKPRALA